MVNVKEKLAKGYIQARIIIEMVGKPKEHIEGTLKGYVEKIKKNFDVLDVDLADIKELKDQGLFATFVEIEILVENLPSLVDFCFDYMPSSIEIIEPKQFSFKETEIGDIFNDLQAKLHSLDMAIKQLRNENNFLKSNSGNLMRNVLRLLLFKEGLELDKISKISGIDEKSLTKFLDMLIKKGEITKQGNKYLWKK
jgi:hypothetical protein